MIVHHLSVNHNNKMKKNHLQSKEDIIKSIGLTVQLQKSLKKLLTDKKKSKKQNYQQNGNQRYEQWQQKMMEQLKTLKNQKQQLLNDNKQLSKQILNYKQCVRQLNKEISQLKSYVDFLQNYNNDLKKEMSFWLKKPSAQNIHAQNQSAIYQKLYSQIDSLKKQNDLRQRQLLQLQKTFDINYQTTAPSEEHLVGKKPLLSKKNSQYLSKKINKIQNQCTSCLKGIRRKSSKQIKLESKSDKIKKKLCPCHKSYIQTSDFLY